MCKALGPEISQSVQWGLLVTAPAVSEDKYHCRWPLSFAGSCGSRSVEQFRAVQCNDTSHLTPFAVARLLLI